MSRIFIALCVLSLVAVAGCGTNDTLVPMGDSGMPMGDGGPIVADAGSCTTSLDCPGLVCDLTDGICVECNGDADCGPGETCNGAHSCVASVPDAAVPAPDAGTGMSDAGMGVDAAASPTDAAVVSALCRNAVLDPGEACDPGHLVANGDGTFHAESFPGDLAFCPNADCTQVACPDLDGGGSVTISGAHVVDPTDALHQYCIYQTTAFTLPAGSPLRNGVRLSWRDAAERNAQFAAIRAQITPGSSGTWFGYVALQHYNLPTPGAWYWQPPYWQTSTVEADAASLPAASGTGNYARLTLTSTGATIARQTQDRTPTGAPLTSSSLLMVSAPNAH